MGKVHLALEKICQILELSYIAPSKPGPKTLKLGQELAPEGSCLPFCLVLGNMREALDNGADAVLMLGGSGPCRFGYFIYLAVQLLKDAGYEFEPLIIDRGHHLNNFTKLQQINRVSLPTLVQAVFFGWELLVSEEMLARIEREYTPLIIDRSGFAKIIAQARYELSIARTSKEIMAIRKVVKDYIRNTKIYALDNILRVGLIGDIYTLLEPYANHQVEEYLCKHEVIVYREMSVSGWLPNLLLPWRTTSYRRELLKNAAPYLGNSVGGFGLETVANAHIMRNTKADGLIQLFPMGCMPEIVARSALNKMCRDEKIPVLCVTMDQHHSKTGFETRLEAFLDMLYNRQQKSQNCTG
jgi:predicted nucleotide-binding protein (sugar kinase/HSP70/actin superfamily)